MRTTRKRVDDLVIGDRIKDFGILTNFESCSTPNAVVLFRAGYLSGSVYPLDAEVSVYIPDPEQGDRVRHRFVRSGCARDSGVILGTWERYGWVKWDRREHPLCYPLNELLKIG